MTLNIFELLRKKIEELPFEITYNGDFIMREDFKLILKSPLKVCGNATYDGQIVNLKGSITGIIEVQCSRCLESLDYNLNVEFDEDFSKLEHNEEIYPIEEESIELKDMVIDNIILSIPLKFLCSEECKGLCPVCGKNLNKYQCDCNKDNIDPRLAVLKDLFKGD
jgi:uncharacterized protein